MVCDDPYAYIDLVVAGLVLDSGHVCDGISDELDCINVEDGINALQYAGKSFKSHSCIDVRMSQSRIRAVFLAVKLSEYVIPELEVSVAVTARLAVRLATAPLRASVEVDLGARSAWSESDLPEVIILAKTYYSLFRHSDDVSPDLESFIVIFINSRPELFLRHLKPFSAEFPSPLK